MRLAFALGTGSRSSGVLRAAWVLWACAMGCILMAALTPQLAPPARFGLDGAMHCSGFAAIMAWPACAMHRVRQRAAIAAAVAALGVAIEYMQPHFGRHFSYEDMAWNSAGVAAGWLAGALLRRRALRYAGRAARNSLN